MFQTVHSAEQVLSLMMHSSSEMNVSWLQESENLGSFVLNQ